MWWWLCWMSDMAYQTTQLLLYPPDNRMLGNLCLGTKTVNSQWDLHLLVRCLLTGSYLRALRTV